MNIFRIVGDFAVLKKNGVPLKKAILYNILSSFLCFVGVVIGIFIGKISFISNWSFLFIAGTFLYISLVNIVNTISYVFECEQHLLINLS